MATPKPKSRGLIDSVKQLGETALALLENRLQLFSVELQEEKYSVLQALLWLAAGMILIFLGLAVGVITVAMLVLNSWGVPGLAGLTLLLLIVGVGVLWAMWSRLKSGGTPFSGTLQELKKDQEWLRRKR